MVRSLVGCVRFDAFAIAYAFCKCRRPQGGDSARTERGRRADLGRCDHHERSSEGHGVQMRTLQWCERGTGDAHGNVRVSLYTWAKNLDLLRASLKIFFLETAKSAKLAITTLILCADDIQPHSFYLINKYFNYSSCTSCRLMLVLPKSAATNRRSARTFLPPPRTTTPHFQSS